MKSALLSVLFLGSILVTPASCFFASNRALWSVTVTMVCLDMDDASYSQMSQAQGEDLSEETITDWMGMETLYCKHGCCGDNRYPECCERDDSVSQNKFETYKIIIIVAAGVGGIIIISIIVVAIVKYHMKKKRLVKDIEAINQMNRMSDITTKVRVKGYEHSGKSKKEEKKKDASEKKKKLFTSSKKTPVVEEQTSTSPPAPSYASLGVDAFLKSQPATAAVKVGDNLAVFLPITAGKVQTHVPAQQPALTNQQPQAPTSTTLAPLRGPAPAATNQTQRAEPNLANFFSSPLADGPIIFSGPYDKTHDSPKKAPSSSSSPKSSSPSSKKNSIGGNSSLTLTSTSPLPDIPWDDDDLDMFFPDPQAKY